MSSCLSSRACGFDLEHLVKWQISNNYSRTTTTTSNSSSPSSTLSESSNSPITISNQKPRTPRKRPNQTYNEAAAVLSMASPNIFKLNNIPKFTKQHLPGFFDHPPELIMNNSGGLLQRQFTNKPCSLTDLKIHNSCQVNEFLDDFDTGSILNEEIEEGIDSIMGDCNSITGNHELIDNNCYGYPMGLGFGVRNGVRALRNAGERNRCNFTMVDVVNTSLAVIGKCVGKKKKKRVEDLMRPKSEVRRGLVLKLDYDAVLNEWADKESPVPEDISHSSSSRGDIHAKAANIDLFSEEDGRNESSATRPTDKNHLKKIRPLKNACSDKRPRCKGRFMKKTNSSGCDEVT
ncbi:protein CHLOROPLAST IMPORT APPARATUS 2-like [Bidens hawaiensis]|uniref:protein CHLOROPLAST IMPORT APPARATUS 2-like n=1 Tax=Bidens hawaiensis TaxID=980011 RepID=UPI00404A95FC